MDTLVFFLSFTLSRILLPAALLLPVFLLLHPLLPGGWGRTAAYYALALYLAAVWIACGLPDFRSAVFHPRLNLTPFVGMGRAPAEAVLNVLLFVPWGFCLPLLYRRFRDGRRAVLAGLALSLFIELMQLFSGHTDVDDLILNTCGAWIGYFIACVLLLGSPRLSKAAPGDGTFADRTLVYLAVFLVMFFAVPLLSPLTR